MHMKPVGASATSTKPSASAYALTGSLPWPIGLNGYTVHPDPRTAGASFPLAGLPERPVETLHRIDAGGDVPIGEQQTAAPIAA